MKKLKLNLLNKQSLDRREMSEIKGGRTCGCGCCGSSSTDDNAIANYNGGKHGFSSPNCDAKVTLKG